MKAEIEELKAIPNKQPEMRASIGCPVGSVGRTGNRISGLFQPD